METIKEDLLELFNKFETYKICIEGKSNSTTTLYIRNIKEFCNDIITDLMKENSGFSDKEIKMVKKHISRLAANLIKAHYNM